MVARIYQPAKNAMQSGRGNSDHWLMDFEASAAKRVEPLMGWTSASDMKNNEVRLKFDSRATFRTPRTRPFLMPPSNTPGKWARI